MNIVVCIKQVPDTTEIRIDPVKNTLIRTGVPSIMNPFDKNALETGLQLKDQYGGKVTVISMGPPQAKEVLREALAMGADEAYLVTDRAFGGSDTYATSYILSEAIKKLGSYDIILGGKQAIDGDTGQTAPSIAEHLGAARLTYVLSLKVEGDKVIARRQVEEGIEVVETQFPVLCTATKENPDFFPSTNQPIPGAPRHQTAFPPKNGSPPVPETTAPASGIDLPGRGCGHGARGPDLQIHKPHRVERLAVPGGRPHLRCRRRFHRSHRRDLH